MEEVEEGRSYPSSMEQTEATVVGLRLYRSNDKVLGSYFEVDLGIHKSALVAGNKVVTTLRIGPELDARDIEGVRAIFQRDPHEIVLEEFAAPDYLRQFLYQRVCVELEHARDEKGRYHPATYVTAIRAVDQTAQ